MVPLLHVIIRPAVTDALVWFHIPAPVLVRPDVSTADIRSPTADIRFPTADIRFPASPDTDRSRLHHAAADSPTNSSADPSPNCVPDSSAHCSPDPSPNSAADTDADPCPYQAAKVHGVAQRST